MARITKKDIYAAYGIEYDPKTQKILTPLGWNRPLLKKGNKKVGEKVLTWSMNTTTCCCHCEGCYGEKGCYCFPSVKKALAINTELAKVYIDFWDRAIRAQLATLPDGTEIRIHCVGDFFSGPYADKWHNICRDFPNLIFWTYTKVKKCENLFDDLDNANIVKSIVNGKLNFGHCGHIIDLHKELKEEGKSVYICRCGIDNNQHCQGCKACSLYEYVLFVEHSTDYKAELDPLYKALTEIINNQ